MRLNLGEIAISLGCGPERIIWRYDESAREPGAESAPRSILSLRDLTHSGVIGGRADALFPDSWSCLIPTGAQVDSRKIRPGNLFFCLPGERTDGHLFALEAARAGACAIVALRNPFWGKEKEARDQGLELPPVLLVQDVHLALRQTAKCHRDTSIARVIGVTGSAGKTSVKEVLAHVLAVHGLTESNPKNFNNQIGLPLSMLNANAEASFWIMEVGISQAHDMDELAGMLKPEMALILNVGDAHLAGLGEKGVAASKIVLLEYLQPGGAALISRDYPDLDAELEKRRSDLARKGVRLIRFSAKDANTVYGARYLGLGHGVSGRYEVSARSGRTEVEAPFMGDFGSENVAAVYAVAETLGLSKEEIVRGLACAVVPEQRFCCRREGAFIVIDDTYNANPLSMSRMIEAARSLAAENDLPLYLVLGEMQELGDKAESAHVETGRMAGQADPACIFWKGAQGGAVRQGLAAAGYGGGFYPVGGGQDFSLLLEELKPVRGVVLFKASRVNQLERLVKIFRDNLIFAGESDAV